jgi:hypothetical protein
MAITSKVLNGQGPRTLETSRAQENNRLRPADTRCAVLPRQQREKISAGQAWCGPGALVALLTILAMAMLALIVVRIWLKLEKVALLIPHLVRTCASRRRAAPGQKYQ